MFFVYILRSLKDKKLYFGFTNDLKRRIEEHNSGKSPATRPRMPLKLMYYEAYTSEEDAKRREHSLKLNGRARAQLKARLIKTLPRD